MRCQLNELMFLKQSSTFFLYFFVIKRERTVEQFPHLLPSREHTRNNTHRMNIMWWDKVTSSKMLQCAKIPSFHKALVHGVCCKYTYG